MEDSVTGHNSTIIIEDNEENREKLKYLHRVDWNKIFLRENGNGKHKTATII